MNKKVASIIVLLIMAAFAVFIGVSGVLGPDDAYKKITGAEAKEMMDANPDAIILDVRTNDEFAEGHIPNAVLLPDFEIASKAEETLPDKDALILVYCRTGRRSANAANELLGMGYTNVYDFGGIVDWRYEVVRLPKV